MNIISTGDIRLLIVDDDEAIISFIQKAIQPLGYLCSTASSAESALVILKNQKVDVVITDIVMSGQTGIDLTHIIKEKYDSDVIVMTGEVEDYTYERIIEEGAGDFIQKPIHIKEFLLRLKRVLRERTHLSERNQAITELQQTLKLLKQNLSGTVKVIAATVEHRDPYTAGHQQRVADLANAIAREMSLSENMMEGIRMAGVIHDLGKIAIPAEILSKPSRLSEIEFNLIKTHAQVGYDILKEIDFTWPIAQIVYQHHERMDGSGYPQGLKGDEILLEARIMAVADVVEAMASHRPALGLDMALGEISAKKGLLYDATAVDVCLRVFAKEKFTFKDAFRS